MVLFYKLSESSYFGYDINRDSKMKSLFFLREITFNIIQYDITFVCPDRGNSYLLVEN